SVYGAASRCSALPLIEVVEVPPTVRLPPPSPRVPPVQLKPLTVSAPEPPKLPPPRVSLPPVQVLLKLSVPASTFRSGVPEPLNMVTLAPLTSSTPPVLPPGTTRKLPLANSTVSPPPSALYTPAFRYWFTSARPSPPLKVSVVPLENPCTSTAPAFNSPARHTHWPSACTCSAAATATPPARPRERARDRARPSQGPAREQHRAWADAQSARDRQRSRVHVHSARNAGARPDQGGGRATDHQGAGAVDGGRQGC